MRVLDHPSDDLEGWVTVAECHGCGTFNKRFLMLDNDHGSVMVLCGQCILHIATAWTKRYGDGDSQG